MNKPELLAPAGSLEKLKFALLYGADAVYLGGTMFGLRANASNFTLEELKEGVEFAHDLHKKVYVTVNIALHTSELKALTNYLKELDQIGVDAIIISDPAIISLAKENTNLELHLSTQQSTLNYEAVKFWKEEGITRIVLGRETTRKEIMEIKKHVDIEIECFIHGAMCASYSGRCVLSNFLTARDSNRGGCSQICRWDFDLLDKGGKALIGEKPFTFCTKDLSLLVYIPDMIDIGITSFKIEGRMRSIYYIATVVDIYRKVIDEYMQQKENYEYNKEYEKVLTNCANRDSVPQFFDESEGVECQYYNGRVEISNQDFLGLILDYQDGYAVIEERNYFKVGDMVEFFGPNIDTFQMKIEEIIDESGEQIDIVRHPKQVVKVKVNKPLYQNDFMRIKK
ncbi:MAG: U32 family peptidase [Bacilli bacterium]|jgi:putative protease|nr:U32 family peptidase [Bacilli bacterium]